MFKFLLKILYFKVPNFILNFLIKKDKMNSIEIIGKDGHYKNRIYLAKYIHVFSYENKLKLIEILLEDNIEYISNLAIKESKKIILKKNLKRKVNEKIEFWNTKKIQTEINKEKNERLLKNSTNRKRKFSNGESYQNLKNMLKKPMNTGKWF
jgi:hypothetical protein|tara:strand:- start:344 stop:799 length:456 start_codon:yes stop_codon:yes gene_type:complete